MSARIDITVYGSRNAANRAVNLELKAGTASLEAFRKDFERLFREGIPGLWCHTVESASSATWGTLSEDRGSPRAVGSARRVSRAKQTTGATGSRH